MEQLLKEINIMLIKTPSLFQKEFTSFVMDMVLMVSKYQSLSLKLLTVIQILFRIIS